MVDSPLQTFLVECYEPSIDREAVAAAAGRLEAVAARLAAADGSGLKYLGTTIVAQDDVVFHSFAALRAELVAAACREAGVAFERVVVSEAVP
jgi:hypothetical protein